MVEYMYRQGELICAADDLDTVLAGFDKAGLDRPGAIANGPAHITVLDIGTRDAADLADTLAAVLGVDDVVTPNHVVDSQGFPFLCPATEPVPWYAPVATLDEPAGRGSARVAVIDTGYLPEVAEQSGFDRFAAVAQTSTPDDQTYVEGTSTLRPYGGHGIAATAQLLAVAGAQRTTVHVDSVVVGGAVDEVAMVEALTAAVESGADVISMQAGTYTRESVPPLAFTQFRDEVLSKRPNTVLVTAAGNDSQDDPFWPAAFDWVTAVGGLTKDGSARADWSNHGDWVDVYAPGDNVVVPYPNGTYEYQGGALTAEFTEGYAWWGTSSVVAGMIARRMIEDDVGSSIRPVL